MVIRNINQSGLAMLRTNAYFLAGAILEIKFKMYVVEVVKNTRLYLF